MRSEKAPSEDAQLERALSEDDRARLEGLEKAVADAVDLKRWWETVDATDDYGDRFRLSATHNRPDHSFGFFSAAEVDGAPMSVMGNVQEQFFDRPKTPGRSAVARKKAADWMNLQVQEFVLRYFMRISDFRQPEAFPDDPPEAPPPYLRPLSWYAHDEGAETGFGFEQMYYQRKDEAEPGKFSDDERYAIVDLREIGTTYEWIVVKVDIFNFDFVLAPFGPDYPHGTVPGTEHSYLILSEKFILNEENPPGGEDLGRYGFGYAFLPATDESLLAYGPGRFEAGFQAIHFHVKKNGEVVSRMAFIANRPEKVVNISLDPVDWGFRMADVMSFGTASTVLEPMQKVLEPMQKVLEPMQKVLEPMQKMWNRMPSPGGVDVVQSYINLANRLTGGSAARHLGVSKKQLHKNFLVAHFAQHYNVVAGSLVTWRQIPDWLDTEALPTWVTSGKSASSIRGG